MTGIDDVGRLARGLAGAAGLGVGAATGVGFSLLNRDRRTGINMAANVGSELSLAAAGVHLEVQGEEHAWSHRPAIFMFNHQSQLDVPIVASVLKRDFTGVAKKSLQANPIFGPIGWFAGVAFIDRTDPAAARAALEPVVQSLRDGVSLAVAPEGTRALELGPFKKGPFHMAIQGQVPVVPIVIRNAGQVMAPHTYLITPGTVQVCVLPPVDTSDWTTETIDEHRDAVRQMFLDTLADWPTPPHG
ncbi:MAG: 1-acyl-sn-glycerol-3-phosphate acyltransferase [Candidatus Nanopelagicales bacterium]|jgi:putative phosphoserine phosphatase/1-acylglycerol-3-phosphate O-acyltransferase|nr:1-acyl-sn-glycerol-3-phosphate acyltransferase [Candidatus Nanopelagicales bacterium]